MFFRLSGMRVGRLIGTRAAGILKSGILLAAPGSPFAVKAAETQAMIRKLPSGSYRLYSRKLNPETGKRRNLGTFSTRAAAVKHERAVQYFKRH